MKIAISAQDKQMDTQFSPRFGRCETFIIIDSETRGWEALQNPAAAARGGAGPQAVQFLSENGVEAAISGRFGPNAYTALEAGGIRTFVASQGTVAEVFDKFLAGELEEVGAATGPELHGRGAHA